MSHFASVSCDMFRLIFNGSQIMSEAPRDTGRDMAEANLNQIVDDLSDDDDLRGFEQWLEESQARQEEHRARQAAGLEPPDNYIEGPREQMPPLPREEVQKIAEPLCQLFEESQNDEWQRLAELIRATISGDGRPTHRPPSSFIAKRNARIVEQVEYWQKAQPKLRKKEIYHDVGHPYGLSARAVKEIVANSAKDMEVPTSMSVI